MVNSFNLTVDKMMKTEKDPSRSPTRGVLGVDDT